jgi:hypothetical protein
MSDSLGRQVRLPASTDARDSALSEFLPHRAPWQSLEPLAQNALSKVAGRAHSRLDREQRLGKIKALPGSNLLSGYRRMAARSNLRAHRRTRSVDWLIPVAAQIH